MKHAFLILAHKNMRQLMQMISVLQSNNRWFFVHIDKKSDMQTTIEFPSNLLVADQQIDINWGGFSMIEATVCLINMLCDSKISPDYVHLLSGQDFPLCSPKIFDQLFENNYGKNFLEYHTIPYKGWAGNGGWDRVNYKWDMDGEEKGKKHLGASSFPSDIQPYGGSQWWSLTGECVKWLSCVCRPGELLYDFYRQTMIPDEMFFQTTLMHSSFAETVVNDNLRYVNWTDGPEYPRILLNSDFDKLLCSGKLIARKFDENVDHQIINQLEKHIQ